MSHFTTSFLQLQAYTGQTNIDRSQCVTRSPVGNGA